MRAKADGGEVFLVLRLELVDGLGGPSTTHDKHACCQRVQRPGVTDFDLFLLRQSAEGVPKFVDDVKRRPRQRLVHHHRLAVKKRLGMVEREVVRGHGLVHVAKVGAVGFGLD